MRTIGIALCVWLLVWLTGMAWAQDAPPPQPTAETITVPRAEWEALKAAVAELQRELAEMKAAANPVAAPAATAPTEAPAPETTTPTEAEPAPQPTAGRSLLLPDISVIVNTQGVLSSDERDPDRNRLQINEAELAVQGYVYPQVKADLFVAMSPRERAAAQVEEAYLTYLAAAKGLNVSLGQKRVPFGRTNTIHPHSWLYARQPLAIRDLVGEEGLIGSGIGPSYVLPTKGQLFAELDLGYWTPTEEEGGEEGLPVGTGAGFHDHFGTARLWLSHPAGANGELEWGASYAAGPGEADGQVALLGTDLSYRRFGQGDKRLLLRGEAFCRNQGPDQAQGYYLLADQRLDRYNEVGLLYDWTEFPQAPSQHESALSFIYTRQFSEQYYVRLQAIGGNRPGADPYQELRLQWVWGMGPHTHNLE